MINTTVDNPEVEILKGDRFIEALCGGKDMMGQLIRCKCGARLLYNGQSHDCDSPDEYNK